MTGGKALPKEITDQIIDRTDGVPLFIEELTKSVVESGGTEAGDRLRGDGARRWQSDDASGLAPCTARPPASTREVAQIGAAIGRSFSHD